MGDFTMPSLGADMDAGTLTKWLVKPGDEVHRGDIVAVVDTDKSTIEVEIFENGVIEQLVVPEGENVPVGTILAHVASTTPGPVKVAPAAPPLPAAAGLATGNGTQARAPGAGPARKPPVYSPLVRHLAQEVGVDLARVRGSGPGGEVTRTDVQRAAKGNQAVESQGRVRSSPLARRLAPELGVDLSLVRGSGPGGSVVERDLRSAAAKQEPVHEPVNEAEMTRVRPMEAVAPRGAAETAGSGREAAMRKAIGALMARSKREIPHYYLSSTIDVGTASGWLEQENLARPVERRLVLPVMLLKATASAVAKFPEMNGFYTEDGFEPSKAVHLGVAISLRSGGVVAPAIHDTDRMTLDELMVALRDLVGRARAGVLRSSEMSDPTITVTNLGDLGVESVFGVIYPPQVALVGFGAVSERPVARDGLLGARPCVTATLSGDHRVSDGHRGGRFLAEINRLLQEPAKL